MASACRAELLSSSSAWAPSLQSTTRATCTHGKIASPAAAMRRHRKQNVSALAVQPSANAFSAPAQVSRRSGMMGSGKAVSSTASRYLGTTLQQEAASQQKSRSQSAPHTGKIVMRVKGEYSFTLKGDLEKIFEYASDFSHIDAWDPGTPSSFKDSSMTRSKQAPLGVGTQFNLRTILFGYVTPTVYEIMEYQAPTFVKLYGVSDFHDSYDSVYFKRDERDPSLIQIKYVSEIQLTGWYKYFEFIMSWVLIQLFKDAIEGLEKKMKSLEPELEPTAARAR